MPLEPMLFLSLEATVPLGILSVNSITLGSEPFLLKKCGDRGLAVYPTQILALEAFREKSQQFHIPGFLSTLLTVNLAMPGFRYAKEILITIIYP